MEVHDHRETRTRHPLFAICTLLACCVVPGCGIPKVTARPSVAYLDIDGSVELSGGGGLAQGKADTSDLGLDEEVVIQGRVDLDWGPWHVSVNGFNADYSGNGVASATLSQPGRPPITVGAPVRSDFEFLYVAGSVVFDILPLDFMDVGVGLGAGVLDYDARIQSRTTNAWIRSDDTLPFGFLTGRIAADVGRFGFLANVSGLGIEWEDDDIQFLDVDASVSFRLFGGEERLHGAVFAGYRYLKVDYEFKSGGSKSETDPELSGPYLGFLLRF